MTAIPPGREQLAQRLLALNAEQQHALVQEAEPALDSGALVEALRLGKRLGDLARWYVMDMLADRGAAAVDEVARALVAEPDSVQAGDLAEVLVDIASAHPAERDQVMDALALALRTALNAGAGSHGATGELIQALAEVAAGGSSADARAAAEAYLAEAARDPIPFGPGSRAARAVIEAQTPS